MYSKRVHLKKKNGIFYTPRPMAEMLVNKAIKRSGLSILDPACGEGVLLKAAVEESRRFSGARRPRLVGCDRFKQRKLDQRIEFVHSDFFKFKDDKKFDLILTNPPYVQSGRIPSGARGKYYRELAKPLGFSSNLDLWVYFLIKSSLHLRMGGAIAAVLPWSFLEAEYAQKVRNWIAENFAKISVLVLQCAHFEDTVKRVLLVWLEDYGSQAQYVQIGCSDKFDSNSHFRKLSIEMWNSENVMPRLSVGVDHTIRRLRQVGFKPMEEYANVSIGIVTGANNYFIHSRKKACQLGFSKSSVLPVLTSVDDLRDMAECNSPNKVMVQFQRMTKRKKKYICQGTNLGLDQRTHCQRREKQSGKWYNIDPGEVPDAFFTYRVSTLPYFILNPNGYQCTNSLHKIFFNGVSKIEKKWIQLSILSVFGQLSLELGARHYGNGILKVEPKTLKRALVYASRTRIPKKSYEDILRDVASDRKEKACSKATRLVVSEAKIDPGLVGDVRASLNKIRKLRGVAKL